MRHLPLQCIEKNRMTLKFHSNTPISQVLGLKCGHLSLSSVKQESLLNKCFISKEVDFQEEAFNDVKRLTSSHALW